LAARWEHFEHEADMGVRGRGADPAQAFEQAALALAAVIADPETVRPERAVSISCTAPNLELLLADWLNALVYEMATRGMLFAEFAVKIAPEPEERWRLEGTARGESVDRERHRPAVEVKGATYTELAVKQTDAGDWIAQCVVDV
jgi:tRNA nucleotidyltransferase (CCA-adding enzyme)